MFRESLISCFVTRGVKEAICQVRLRAPSGSRLFPPPGLRLVLTTLSRTSPRHVARNAGWNSGVSGFGFLTEIADCLLQALRRLLDGFVFSIREGRAESNGDSARLRPLVVSG